jgi:hypothetical protein
MRLLSYGEDALTLAAVTGGLRSFLDQLDDPTEGVEALVLYRPSFGRRSGVAEKPRSEFGEFDAIIGTPRGTYLVEAKWSASSELVSGVLTLRPEQIRRHRVLRRYVEVWRELGPPDWDAFATSPAARSVMDEPGLSLPSPGTTLAANLEFVLQQVRNCGPVRDVILVSAPGEIRVKVDEVPEGFELVQFGAPSIGGAGFIGLSLEADTAQ